MKCSSRSQTSVVLSPHLKTVCCAAEIAIPNGAWILGNVNYTGFYHTNYDDAIWRQLTEQLHRDHTVLTLSLSSVACVVSWLLSV